MNKKEICESFKESFQLSEWVKKSCDQYAVDQLKSGKAYESVFNQTNKTGQRVYEHCYNNFLKLGASKETAAEMALDAYLDFAGTSKGSIAGHKLEKIVFDIASEILGEEHVYSQYSYPGLKENADVYIKYGDLEIILYIQVDMWNGGAQGNRQDKYLSKLEELTTNSSKFFAVVSNPMTWKYNSKDKTALQIYTQKGRDYIMYVEDLKNYLKSIK